MKKRPTARRPGKIQAMAKRSCEVEEVWVSGVDLEEAGFLLATEENLRGRHLGR